MRKLIRLTIGSALVLAPALSAAQSSPANDDHPWPRPEAVAACKDKSEGDSCEFEGHHGHVAGTCRKVKTGDLACVHPHHHHDDGGAP